MNDVMVSIVCTTYNHEKYVRDALDGFIMQKTNFAYEVLVHDDASTDKTRDIINEYVSKYPDVIKPIFQEENKYSKGISIYKEYLWPRVRGKYVAICEGDDYWTEPYKLQTQYDALENNNKIDCCVHRVKKVKAEDKILSGYMAPYNCNKIISVNKVILGGGGYVATNSLFFRSVLLSQKYPFTNVITLDYVWQIHGALRGGLLYLNDCMGAYRVGAIGSWSEMMEVNVEKRNMHTQKVIEMLNQLNIDTEGKYKNCIEAKIASCYMNILSRTKRYKDAFTKPYNQYFMKVPMKGKIKFLLLMIKNAK